MASEKILVVEDERHNLIILERMLTLQGYHVSAVSNGEAALELAKPEIFDVAILDLNLGRGISGMEVLAHFRENSPDTVILLLTGNGTLETAVEALRQGAHDYLLKPAKAKDIQASIRLGLEKRKKKIEQRKREAILLQLEQNLEDSLQRLRGTVDSPRSDNSPINTAGSIETLAPAAAPGQQNRYLLRGNIQVDLPRHEITINGRPLDLSPTEYALFLYLISNAPHIIPPQELVRHIQGYEIEQDEASTVTRTHIYRLRQKIKAIVPDKEIIRTVRGIGYTIES